MKITIYELLGLIKEGKAPTKIKYDNYIWTLRTQFNDYWNDITYLIESGFDEWENSKDFLNATIEIIEEEKEIELLHYHDVDNELEIDGRMYKMRVLDKALVKKINELIDEIKKLKEQIK